MYNYNYNYDFPFEYCRKMQLFCIPRSLEGMNGSRRPYETKMERKNALTPSKTFQPTITNKSQTMTNKTKTKVKLRNLNIPTFYSKNTALSLSFMHNYFFAY